MNHRVATKALLRTHERLVQDCLQRLVRVNEPVSAADTDEWKRLLLDQPTLGDLLDDLPSGLPDFDFWAYKHGPNPISPWCKRYYIVVGNFLLWFRDDAPAAAVLGCYYLPGMVMYKDAKGKKEACLCICPAVPRRPGDRHKTLLIAPGYVDLRPDEEDGEVSRWIDFFQKFAAAGGVVAGGGSPPSLASQNLLASTQPLGLSGGPPGVLSPTSEASPHGSTSPMLPVHTSAFGSRPLFTGRIGGDASSASAAARHRACTAVGKSGGLGLLAGGDVSTPNGDHLSPYTVNCPATRRHSDPSAPCPTYALAPAHAGASGNSHSPAGVTATASASDVLGNTGSSSGSGPGGGSGFGLAPPGMLLASPQLPTPFEQQLIADGFTHEDVSSHRGDALLCADILNSADLLAPPRVDAARAAAVVESERSQCMRASPTPGIPSPMSQMEASTSGVAGFIALSDNHFSVDDPRESHTHLTQIGMGSQGEVYRAQSSDGEVVALKRINLRKPTTELRALANELRILAEANHPNIVRFIHCYEASPTQLWVSMEYMDGGKLADLIGTKNGGQPFNDADVAYVANGLCRALAYVHANGMLHRDVKSDNVLLSRAGVIKLADFGMGADITTQKRETVVGTPYWMAPEVIKGAPYDDRADMWSVGIVCIEMIDGQPPHLHLSHMGVLFTILSAPPPKPERPVSEGCAAFLDALLKTEPEERSSSQGACLSVFLNAAHAAGQAFLERHPVGEGGDAGAAVSPAASPVVDAAAAAAVPVVDDPPASRPPAATPPVEAATSPPRSPDQSTARIASMSALSSPPERRAAATATFSGVDESQTDIPATMVLSPNTAGPSPTRGEGSADRSGLALPGFMHTGATPPTFAAGAEQFGTPTRGTSPNRANRSGSDASLGQMRMKRSGVF